MRTFLKDFDLNRGKKRHREIVVNRAAIQIPMLSFSVYALLENIKKEFFPNLNEAVSIGFVEQDNLACIQPQMNPPFIYVHTLMNGGYTPVEVMSLIIKHELLHLIIPSRTINDKETHHPPEFWEHESLIAPESSKCWCWIWCNFGQCLKRCQEEEKTKVLRKWKSVLKHHWESNKPNIIWDSIDSWNIEKQELPKEGEFIKWL